jgi:uncharacterized coiled-coil protein SlyX
VEELLRSVTELENRLNSANEQLEKSPSVEQLTALESRAHELELRDAEKIRTIENLNRSLASSTGELKELQGLSEQRYQELAHRETLILELEGKVKEAQAARVAAGQDLGVVLGEKRSLIRKNEVLMEELFSYKKKFEEEKGRSVSTLHVRSAEEYTRVKTLENELTKK